MIISSIYSGLGNQMFQYAAGRRLAHKLGTEFKLDINSFKHDTFRPFELSHFKISAQIATDDEIHRLRFKHFFGLEKLYLKVTKKRILNQDRYIQEPALHQFHPALLDAKDNSYLVGFWQSEKYFSDIKDILKAEFTLKDPISDKAKQYAELIRNSESICIHFRRGDYVQSEKNGGIHKTCPIEYYNQAFSKIECCTTNPHLFFFSDDLEWVQQNITFPAKSTLIEGNSAYEDLWLMSLCKHFIIANSTFSWWGAWLSNFPDKVVCAPRVWFSGQNHDLADLLPQEWLVL